MRVFWLIFMSGLLTLTILSCADNTDERISFYRVRSAGSDTFAVEAMKPFFIATTIEDEIYQAWVNKQNTMVAVMRVKGSSKAGMEQIMRQLFTANNLSGELLKDQSELENLAKSLKGGKDWLTDTEAASKSR